MKSRRLLPFVFVALIGAACSGSDAVVASVNGVDIHESDVVGLRVTGGEVVNAADFRNDLSLLIFQQVMATNLESEYGIEITEDDVDAALTDRLESTGQTVEEAVTSLQEPGATEQMLTFNQYFELLIQAGEEALASEPERIQQLVTETPELITTVCVRHILVDTAGAATEVFNRLEAGEDFGVVANEVSNDEGAIDGSLGCSPAARYVEEFAAASMLAPIGEVFGPVETQFGQHLLIVDERTQPTTEDVAADIRAYVPPDVLRSDLITWFNGLIREADIDVLSRVGEWSPDGPGIRPPE